MLQRWNFLFYSSRSLDGSTALYLLNCLEFACFYVHTQPPASKTALKLQHFIKKNQIRHVDFSFLQVSTDGSTDGSTALYLLNCLVFTCFLWYTQPPASKTAFKCNISYKSAVMSSLTGCNSCFDATSNTFNLHAPGDILVSACSLSVFIFSACRTGINHSAVFHSFPEFLCGEPSLISLQLHNYNYKEVSSPREEAQSHTVDPMYLNVESTTNYWNTG